MACINCCNCINRCHVSTPHRQRAMRTWDHLVPEDVSLLVTGQRLHGVAQLQVALQVQHDVQLQQTVQHRQHSTKRNIHTLECRC
jgi:hypothetical protein